ncbi:MAG: ATP-dependent Clp protease proteolytic subunit [Nitrososphaerota archaeon]|nr:ATP-dependent Clp protease proteolytic subunit [Nitrososphaerota archaeon]MDG7036911.1 ATP-dependent Clp protease proteolytic subunit [Nitrososphaerota archaeon]MDG7037629.1 ATP-dependent Clp protease proteolytic subunit [Nitrososphaerota archaeon]
MGRIERQKLIKRIERARNSRLLVYITGDRKGLESRIAVDALPFCLNHLSRMGKQKKIDLYIYSTGGVTIAGYALVNTIREFCDSFNVIIPFKALSCATLIALGADEIVMTKMGQLSPIDPSVTSPFGPQISVPGPMNVTQTVPVNVEDVISYLELAKRELNLKDEDSLVRVFDRLAQSISPLALGTINRTREQISFLAKMLLSRHMHDEKKMEQIIQTITKGRFSHDYMVGRSEAKNVLGLDIVDTPARLDKDILNLYYEYDQLLQLSTPYNPEAVLGQKDTEVETFNRAIIESDNLAYVFRTTKEVKRVTFGPPQVPTPTVGYSERVLSENWIEDKDI